MFNLLDQMELMVRLNANVRYWHLKMAVVRKNIFRKKVLKQGKAKAVALHYSQSFREICQKRY